MQCWALLIRFHLKITIKKEEISVNINVYLFFIRLQVISTIIKSTHRVYFSKVAVAGKQRGRESVSKGVKGECVDVCGVCMCE